MNDRLILGFFRSERISALRHFTRLKAFHDCASFVDAVFALLFPIGRQLTKQTQHGDKISRALKSDRLALAYLFACALVLVSGCKDRQYVVLDCDLHIFLIVVAHSILHRCEFVHFADDERLGFVGLFARVLPTEIKALLHGVELAVVGHDGHVLPHLLRIDHKWLDWLEQGCVNHI